jgi:hypothetical protein
MLAFSCISYNITINTEKFKSFLEVYPIEGNPIEVYPIEAYLIGKGVVEVSGCSRLPQFRNFPQSSASPLLYSPVSSAQDGFKNQPKIFLESCGSLKTKNMP